MRRLIVAGNWKMFGSKAMAEDLVTGIKENTDDFSDVDIALFPPFVYFSQVQQLLADTRIALGAQNVASEEQGAYTGEIAASMLPDFGCHYVIVGHSERRQYYGETDAIIAKKFHLAQQVGLTPILCIGETLHQRQTGATFDVIKNQINPILTLENGFKLLQNAILAYEPVWAIGTGMTATPEQAQEVHAYIRMTVAASDPNIAAELRIIYGGSVKSQNAETLLQMPDIDGALVGGASLKIDEFTEICRCKK